MDKSYAFTLTLSPDVINNISPRTQVILVTKYLSKILCSISLYYKYTLEFTKNGNVHVHGVIKYDSNADETTFKIMLQSVVLKYKYVMIKLFGIQTIIKPIFDYDDWIYYIIKNYNKTKYIFNKLKLDTELITKEWELNKQLKKIIIPMEI